MLVRCRAIFPFPACNLLHRSLSRTAADRLLPFVPRISFSASQRASGLSAATPPSHMTYIHILLCITTIACLLYVLRASAGCGSGHIQSSDSALSLTFPSLPSSTSRVHLHLHLPLCPSYSLSPSLRLSSALLCTCTMANKEQMAKDREAFVLLFPQLVDEVRSGGGEKGRERQSEQNGGKSLKPDASFCGTPPTT